MLNDDIKLYRKDSMNYLKRMTNDFNIHPSLLITTDSDPVNDSYLKGIISDCTFLDFPYRILDVNDPFLVESNFYGIINISSQYRFISPAQDIEGKISGLFDNACAKGIIDYLKYNNFRIDGKNVTIVGRGKNMGKPLTTAFLKENANVTVLHSHTSEIDMGKHLSISDIIITATNVPNQFNLKSDFFNESQIIIDTGTCFDDSGKLCGNIIKYIDYPNFIASPGGGGLLTRLALIKNLIQTCIIRGDEKHE